MARISKVKPEMTEDINKRGEDREKFVTAWEEKDGRTQRTAVFRKYAIPVHAQDKVELPEKAQADFEDVEKTEYLAKTWG